MKKKFIIPEIEMNTALVVDQIMASNEGALSKKYKGVKGGFYDIEDAADYSFWSEN